MWLTLLQKHAEVPKVKSGAEWQRLRSAEWGRCRLCRALVWRQLPVAAGEGWSGGLLPVRSVGSSGQWTDGVNEAGSVPLVGCPVGTLGVVGR